MWKQSKRGSCFIKLCKSKDEMNMKCENGKNVLCAVITVHSGFSCRVFDVIDLP